MTYEESYRQALTPEELLERVKCDIVIAMFLNRDRVSIIKQVAEKVLNEKFPDFEGTIED